MLAAGVAFADLMLREGAYPLEPGAPLVPGYDLFGTVEAVGPGVDGFAAGDHVVAMTVSGSYATRRLVPAAWCVKARPDLDPAAATAIVLNYMTAWQMLHRVACVEPGETIIVHSAAGGVGTAMLELARLAGIRAIGFASAPKHDRVRALGGLPVDYRQPDAWQATRELTSGGAAAVFDPIGGGGIQASFDALKPTGTLVLFGALGLARQGRLAQVDERLSFLGAAPSFPAAALSQQSKGVSGYFAEGWRDLRPVAYREDLARLVALLAEGKLAPVIAARLPLADAAEAHRRLGAGEAVGKIVLVNEL